jgi:L-lysine 2,3-aminomutase
MWNFLSEIFKNGETPPEAEKKLASLLVVDGSQPYYTFNMKGKEETRKYMAPIARLLQERKEKARLLPGLDRTDDSRVITNNS